LSRILLFHVMSVEALSLIEEMNWEADSCGVLQDCETEEAEIEVIKVRCRHDIFRNET